MKVFLICLFRSSHLVTFFNLPANIGFDCDSQELEFCKSAQVCEQQQVINVPSGGLFSLAAAGKPLL